MQLRISIVAVIAAPLMVSPATAEGVRYVCADNTELTATFHSDPGSADLVFAGSNEHVTLPQALSADGGRYASGNTEFWIKGNDATLTRGDSRTTCKH